MNGNTIDANHWTAAPERIVGRRTNQVYDKEDYHQDGRDDGATFFFSSPRQEPKKNRESEKRQQLQEQKRREKRKKLSVPVLDEDGNPLFLTLDQAVRNIVEFTIAGVPEAIQMATVTPARSIGVVNRKGVLEPGKDADIILLDDDLNVLKTLVAGEVVYEA